MSDQIPPEPPDGALVVMKGPASVESRLREVRGVWERRDRDRKTVGDYRWFLIGNPTPGRYLDIWLTYRHLYVVNEFVDLYRYNGMEYPK